MSEIIYRCKKAFKYNGKAYKPGDVWEPAGFKFDEQIANPENGVVSIQDERITTRADRKIKTKQRAAEVEKAEMIKAVVLLRDSEPPTTWDTVCAITGLSKSTARRYYEQGRDKETNEDE